MILVVDASVLGAIVFGEPEGGEMANYLEGATLLAPALVDFELANIAVKKLRRAPERLPAIVAALEHAQGLRIDRIAVPPVDALSVAAKTGLTAYDAAYLWVAMSTDSELVTLDHQLAEADQRLRSDGL